MFWGTTRVFANKMSEGGKWERGRYRIQKTGSVQTWKCAAQTLFRKWLTAHLKGGWLADSLFLVAFGLCFSFEPRSHSSWGGPWSPTEQDGNDRTSAFLLPRGLSRGSAPQLLEGLVGSLLVLQHHETTLLSTLLFPLLSTSRNSVLESPPQRIQLVQGLM